MNRSVTVVINRDCAAVQIPSGGQVTLPSGTSVDIAQTLGGSFTVHAPGGLFRITGKDADALGMQPESAPTLPENNGELTEKMAWDILKSCFDPEIPVNIVDLGLVYDLAIEPLPDKGNKVFVKMTLTAPGCGMGAAIAGDAQQKLLSLPSVQDASVEVVWDPPGHQSMITADGRRILGLD